VDSEETPVDFALRIKDEVLYYNNIAGSDTRPELWAGIPMAVMPALINSQLDLAAVTGQSDTTLGTALDAAAASLRAMFSSSGLDPESFLTLTRLPDGEANGAPVTRMQLDISLSEMARAEGFAGFLNALTASTDPTTTTDITDEDIELLATAFGQTSVEFKVRIDPASALFQSGELIIESVFDPATTGGTSSPATINFDLLVSLRDIDEPQTITVPDGINVLSPEVANALLQAMVTPQPTAAFALPTPTEAAPPAPQATPTVASVTPVTGVELVAGVPAQITLPGNAPVALTTNGTRGDVITVSARSLNAAAGLDTTLELLDPNGVRIGFNDDISGSQPGFNVLDSLVPNIKLPVDGVYRIVVSSFAPGISGPVEVLLTNGSAPLPTSTPSSASLTYPIETIEQRTVPASGRDCLTLDLLGRENVTISARALDAALDTQLTLNAPDGSQLAFNDDHGTNNTALGRFDSLLDAQPISVSGQYEVCVSGFSGSSGRYELSIVRQRPGGLSGIASPTATPGSALQTAQVITGQIASGEQFEAPFDAQAGDVFTITVRATGGDLDPQTGVFADNENDLLFFSDDQGNSNPDLAPTDAVISNLIIQETGVYDVVVAGYQDTSGPFELTIEPVASGAPLGTPEVQTFTGKLTANGVYTTSVNLPEGAYVTITVIAGDDQFDPQLTLLDPNGVVVAANDDHSSEDESLNFLDSRIRNYFVTTPGEHTIEIRGYQGSGGPFTLTIGLLQ
ncbi:MAG: hypothetical protein JNL34_11100, partial [Anaerolineae bacterium]|nr:hypothetical protein [Anaerolineae bacterium]